MQHQRRGGVRAAPACCCGRAPGGRGRGRAGGQSGGALGDPRPHALAVDGAEVVVARELAHVVQRGGRADAAEVVPAEDDEALRVREEDAEPVFCFWSC